MGDPKGAGYALAEAVGKDRRILPTLRADLAFRDLEEVFRQADEEFFDWVFAP
jgi:hypothetical protein